MTKFWDKLYIHPLTLFVFVSSLITGYFKYFFIIVLILIVHELGHIFFMKLFKRDITKITVLPFGGLIQIDGLISSNIYEDLLISIGGITGELVLSLVLCIMFKFDLISFNFYNLVNTYNMSIIGFNLLPVIPLDGGRMIKLLMELITPFRLTFIYSLILSYILLTIYIVNNITLFKTNYLILIFILILIYKEYKNKPYIINRFYIERINHNFKYPKRYIKSINYMKKNKTHIIDNIYEKEYLKLWFSTKEK